MVYLISKALYLFVVLLFVVKLQQEKQLVKLLDYVDYTEEAEFSFQEEIVSKLI